MSKILILTMLLSLFTGGAVYAANGAGPGDVLYPVDRTVENLRLDLAPDVDKADELRSEFAAERIAEAQDLLQDNDEDGDKENSAFCGPDASGELHPVGQGLAENYEDLTYEMVMGWFCDGFGFGQIMLALETAENTGTSAEELLARRADMGWGEIWQDLELIGKPGEDEDGPDEENGPPFDVPRGPKEGKGKPADVPRGRGDDAGPPGDEDGGPPGPPFEVPGGPPFGSPGGRP